MIAVAELYPTLSLVTGSENCHRELRLESTLEELTLHNFCIDADQPGISLAKAFADNPLLPGAILTEKEKFLGTISRRRFLEHLSRPYGVELFLQRPLKSLYRFTQAEVLIFPNTTLIVMAARRSLQRSPEFLYEPLVVEGNNKDYQLLDVHQLLVAQAQIHELATRLLHEQSQSQMIQTEKMASLGRMVAGVAHEIRNPVNCVGGNLSFLVNYFEDLMRLLSAYEAESQESSLINKIKEEIEINFLREDLPQILQSMQVGTERLVQIVSSLHSFSHMDETKRKEADLHECIDSTLLILNNRLKYGIEVVKNYGDLPLVRCYSGQLSQVFMNILSNAIDALTDEGPETGGMNWTQQNWQPKIQITTQLCTSTGDQDAENAPWVAIRIADNGPGIPPQIQQRIFETFFTTKPVGKGTGLGLAISHQIVTQKHKGKLNLRSQLGQGTEFEILLPLA